MNTNHDPPSIYFRRWLMKANVQSGRKSDWGGVGEIRLWNSAVLFVILFRPFLIHLAVLPFATFGVF